MSENNRVKLWMKMVDKRGCEGVVGNKLISECLSHDQALPLTISTGLGQPRSQALPSPQQKIKRRGRAWDRFTHDIAARQHHSNNYKSHDVIMQPHDSNSYNITTETSEL